MHSNFKLIKVTLSDISFWVNIKKKIFAKETFACFYCFCYCSYIFLTIVFYIGIWLFWANWWWLAISDFYFSIVRCNNPFRDHVSWRIGHIQTGHWWGIRFFEDQARIGRWRTIISIVPWFGSCRYFMCNIFLIIMCNCFLSWIVHLTHTNTHTQKFVWLQEYSVKQVLFCLYFIANGVHLKFLV